MVYYMRSVPSLRDFPNVVVEIVPYIYSYRCVVGVLIYLFINCFTQMFDVCCCCNLMMFYDWSGCAMSVLGTTKHF